MPVICFLQGLLRIRLTINLIWHFSLFLSPFCLKTILPIHPEKKKWWHWWNVLTFDWTKLWVAYTDNKNNVLRARTNYFVVVYVRSDGNNLRISTLEISVLIQTGEFLLNGSSSISLKFLYSKLYVLSYNMWWSVLYL